MTHVLWAVQQSHRDYANDPLIDDIPTFDREPDLYFEWILKV